MESKFTEYATLQTELNAAITQNAPEEEIDNALGLRWNNVAPMIRANQLTQKLGEPYRYSTGPGGVAIWYYVDPYFREQDVYDYAEGERLKPTNVYSKLMIKDEEVPHIVPVPHIDYFYASMFVDVPSDKVDDVRNLTESAGYDTMRREAYARCHFMPANLTSLYLIKQIAQGHKSLEHAMQEYMVLIPTLAKEAKMGAGLRDDVIGPWHSALTNYTFGLE